MPLFHSWPPRVPLRKLNDHPLTVDQPSFSVWPKASRKRIPLSPSQLIFCFICLSTFQAHAGISSSSDRPGQARWPSASREPSIGDTMLLLGLVADHIAGLCPSWCSLSAWLACWLLPKQARMPFGHASLSNPAISGYVLRLIEHVDLCLFHICAQLPGLTC